MIVSDGEFVIVLGECVVYQNEIEDNVVVMMIVVVDEVDFELEVDEIVVGWS